MDVFDVSSKATLGRSVYLIERHFTGTRDFRQAVYSAVENEAKRLNAEKESA
jgi:hypothetical protein